jgi:hypothetical protein
VAAANAANAAIVSTYNALKLPSNDPNTVPDDMANRLATYVLMYSATFFGQAFAAAFEALKTLLKKALEAVKVLTDFFGMKADTAASLVTFDKCDFASTCGENSSATSGSGLLPFGRVQINNSTDLSGCIKANDGGCVYGISLRRSEGIYQYTVTVDAQGPSGILSGSMYLRFTDQTGDVYLLTIFSSDRKTHTVSYNSDKPAITKIEWSNWLF